MNTHQKYVGWLVSFCLGCLASFIVFRDEPKTSVTTREKLVYQTNEGARVTVNGPTFQWKDIESSDYQAYKRNLQRIGVPAKTIADILRADVAELFQAKYVAIDKRNRMARLLSNRAEMAKINSERQALDQEKAATLKQLIGEEVGLASDNLEFSYVSKEKRQKAAEVFQNYASVLTPLTGRPTEEEMALRTKAANERNQAMKEILSPAEYENFMLDKSGKAQVVSRNLEGLNPSEDEFRKLFRIFDETDMRMVNNQFEPALDQKLREALSPERYAEFLKLNQIENRVLLNEGRRYGIDPEITKQAITIFENQPDAQKRADALRQILPESVVQTYIDRREEFGQGPNPHLPFTRRIPGGFGK